MRIAQNSEQSAPYIEKRKQRHSSDTATPNRSDLEFQPNEVRREIATKDTQARRVRESRLRVRGRQTATPQVQASIHESIGHRRTGMAVWRSAKVRPRRPMEPHAERSLRSIAAQPNMSYPVRRTKIEVRRPNIDIADIGKSNEENVHEISPPQFHDSQEKLLRHVSAIEANARRLHTRPSKRVIQQAQLLVREQSTPSDTTRAQASRRNHANLSGPRRLCKLR